MSKRIPELDRITEIDNTCLFVVNEPSEAANGNDRAINKPNLVKSLGSSGVQGFTAVESVDNKLTLTPANNAIVDTYYQGMVIGFRSPITSDDDVIVEVKIGALPYHDLLETDDTATALEANVYYEFYYFGTSFYRKNIPNTIVYTPDYNCVGAIDLDDATTTYELTSSFGTPKTELYLGMSVIFTPDIDSAGTVYINIDGTGDKQLTDSADDRVINPIKALDTILARYNGTKFIKNRFDQSAPPAPPLPDVAYEEVMVEVVDDEGDIVEVPEIVLVPENIPAVNKNEVTVGTGGQFTTVKAAIQNLKADYSFMGENYYCTIKLLETYAGEGGGGFDSLIINEDLSWITIKTNTSVNLVTSAGAFIILRADGAINLTGDYTSATTNSLVYLDESCRGKGLLLKNLNCTFTAIVAYRTNCIGVHSKGNVTIDNCNFSGFDYFIAFEEGSKFGDIKINDLTVTNCLGALLFIFSGNGILSGNLYIKDSTFTKSRNDSANSPALRAGGFQNITLINVNVTNTFGIGAQIGFVYNLITLQKATLVDCVIKGATNQSSLRVNNTYCIVNGGAYQTVTNQTSANNMVADGSGTFKATIALKNNPSGGSSSVNGGEIINV